MVGYSSDQKNVYDVVRDYIKHEDTLIFQRLSGYSTVQAFLVATYGPSLQKKLEVVEKIAEKFSGSPVPWPLSLTMIHIEVFLIALCLAGLALSIAAFFSINAAQVAIANLRSHLEAQQALPRFAFLAEYPKATGGGSDQAWHRGPIFGLLVPLLLSALWMALLVMTIGFWGLAGAT